MRDDETIIKCELGTVGVRNDNGPLPEQNQGHVYLEVNNDVTEEAAFIGVCADELRDAIDKAVGPREGAEPARPYRPIDRDRLLRHIEDIEAALARRNRRHEEDQERIRELEGIAMRRGDRIDELEAKLEAEAAAPSPEEQIEARRKEYEGKGLADWEIELLMGEGA